VSDNGISETLSASLEEGVLKGRLWLDSYRGSCCDKGKRMGGERAAFEEGEMPRQAEEQSGTTEILNIQVSTNKPSNH